MDRPRRVGIVYFLILLGLAGVYLAGNDRVPLWDRDEPRYALCSRYMLQTGDWVVPHIGWGEDPSTWRTAKPVLIYWVQAASMALNGVNTFAARLPSTVAMLGVVALVGWCVSWRVGFKRGLWTMIVLGGSAMPIVAAKMCVTDAVLLLWVTIAQLSAYAIYRGNRSWGVFIAFWGALGLGGLTKGPVVLGHVGTTLAVLAILDYRLKRQALLAGSALQRSGPVEPAPVGTAPDAPPVLEYQQQQKQKPRLGPFASRLGAVIAWWGRFRILRGLILMTAVVAPWLILMTICAPGFLSSSLGHDVINRMKTGLEGHSGPPGYYLATIFGTLYPWSLLLPLAIVAGFKTRHLRSVRFALAAVIGPWLMMELISTKLVHYVLPIFPPLAYLTAEAIVRCLSGRMDDLRNRLTQWGAGFWALCTIAMGGGVAMAWFVFPDAPVLPAIIAAAVGVGYAILVLVLFLKKRPGAALLSLGLGFPVWVVILFTIYLPSADYLRLSVRVAEDLQTQGATEPGEVITTGFDEQSLVFHSGAVVQTRYVEFLAVTPVNQWPKWVILTQKIYADLPFDRRQQLTVISTYRGLNIAKGEIVDLMLVRRKTPVAEERK